MMLASCFLIILLLAPPFRGSSETLLQCLTQDFFLSPANRFVDPTFFQLFLLSA